jgi:hypothetical protein
MADWRLCHVAFLDVLGWKDLVSRSANDAPLADRLATTLDEAGKSMTFFPGGGSAAIEHGDLVLRQFSDSIIAFYDTSPGRYFTFEEWPRQIWRTCRAMLMNGLFMRGGMTFGELHHHDNPVGRSSVTFGPALTKAAELEKLAVYPRILVETDGGGPALLVPDDLPAFLGQPEKHKYDGLFRRDESDAKWYFDVLAINPFEFRHQPDRQLWNEHQRKFLSIVRSHIDGSLRRFENELPIASRYKCALKILKKYVWFANYFNIHAREAGVEEIRLNEFLARQRRPIQRELRRLVRNR